MKLAGFKTLSLSNEKIAAISPFTFRMKFSGFKTLSLSNEKNAGNSSFEDADSEKGRTAPIFVLSKTR